MVWESVQNFYRVNATPCRLSRLTLSMVQHEPFPRLACKAMEMRHLLPAVEHFLQAWVANPMVPWFHFLVKMSCGLDNIVFSNKSMVLTVQERHALREGIFKYNQALTKFAWHFHERGMAFCNFTVKNHYLCHMALDAAKTGVSPRLAFCYEGEDFMSLIKKLCGASNRGVESAKLIDKIIPKYLLGLDLLLKNCT